MVGARSRSAHLLLRFVSARLGHIRSFHTRVIKKSPGEAGDIGQRVQGRASLVSPRKLKTPFRGDSNRGKQNIV